jgi:hypothetical protein
VRLEGLHQLKRNYFIRIRTRYLPACSIVPQPTTLPHAEVSIVQYFDRVWVPMKLVRLIKMCLNETCGKVRIGKHLSDNLPIQNGLKQVK